MTTLRRAPEAEGGDPVALLTTGEQNTMTRTATWDPLGMAMLHTAGAASLWASLMVSNDRLHDCNAALLMVVKQG